MLQFKIKQYYFVITYSKNHSILFGVSESIAKYRLKINFL